MVGREVAGHQILQRVATGRLCSTYRATHTAMNRLVAFKALSPDANANTLAKFQQTARHSALLHHPNIASIYDVNSDGGVHFCTMEYVEGQTIGELLHAHRRFPSADAIRVAIDVAEALRFSNSKGVPGWRLSANRVVISKRGEVKILPPTFSPAGAPVLDDRYVIGAVGVLLYAMLSGGKVHDLEWALEPGSSVRKQLDRLHNAAPGIRRDVAQVVERLLGIAGEPFHSVDAALHGLRALLAAKEQLETRARSLADSARARTQRTRTRIYVAIGAVAFVGLVILVLFIARSGVAASAEKEYARAAAAAGAAFKAFEEAQKQFLAAPDDASAKQAAAHLERAKAAFAAVAADYPDHPRGQAAAQNARSVDEQLQRFRDLAQAEIRYAAARVKIEEADKAFERDIAARLEQGGDVDAEVWRRRYLAVAKEFADNARAAESIKVILANLPRHVLRAQMKIDTNAVANDVKSKYLSSYQYGKAIEAWNEYRRKYGKAESDALRKEALQNYDTKTTEIRQLARLKWAELNQQAKYHVGKQDYQKARDIYNRILENFGILEYTERAKEELAKLPNR
ncbi:MAG TPA: protein kinase [Planctomycetota bacterium]|nr:protein kinase [Planctomycetota bacterium]